jgi:hypothetical protein
VVGALPAVIRLAAALPGELTRMMASVCIRQALQAMNTVAPADFISQVQRMAFRVSFHAISDII